MITVWRDNRIDQEESYSLPELAKMFRASCYATNEYLDSWPLSRCVGTWFASWAIIEKDDFNAFVDYLAGRK